MMFIDVHRLLNLDMLRTKHPLCAGPPGLQWRKALRISFASCVLEGEDAKVISICSKRGLQEFNTQWCLFHPVPMARHERYTVGWSHFCTRPLTLGQMVMVARWCCLWRSSPVGWDSGWQQFPLSSLHNMRDFWHSVTWFVYLWQMSMLNPDHSNVFKADDRPDG